MENFDEGAAPTPDSPSPDLRVPPGVVSPAPGLSGLIKSPRQAPPSPPAGAESSSTPSEVFDSSWDAPAEVPMEASEEDQEFLESLLPPDPAADRRVVTTLLRALLAENRGP